MGEAGAGKIDNPGQFQIWPVYRRWLKCPVKSCASALFQAGPGTQENAHGKFFFVAGEPTTDWHPRGNKLPLLAVRRKPSGAAKPAGLRPTASFNTVTYFRAAP